MDKLQELSRLIRYHSIRATAAAGSGHLTSSLSATEIMTTLLFGGTFRFDTSRPRYEGNDRLIFSKGHASPLFYSLWRAAGVLSEKKLLSFRKMTPLGSEVQGHPTTSFRFAEATTGSLGQGLSIGFGMALSAKYLDASPARTYVLLGDSEIAEGSIWEAFALAAHCSLANLVAIIDVNRLGQRGETMYGHDTAQYVKKAESFGWAAHAIDGHSIAHIQRALRASLSSRKPTAIFARTVKGKGVSFLEDAEGWHGKAPSASEAERALRDIGPVDATLRGNIAKPRSFKTKKRSPKKAHTLSYDKGARIATRKAYGESLVSLGESFPDMVVLDAETGNSTYAELFKREFPERFFEMYIAEQNMAGAALGLSRRGKKVFASSFAAFLTRAFDQIRMGAYSDSNVVFCGSHAGVSIGEDGISQMGLEDIAMFRSVFDSTVVYPSDACSTQALLSLLAKRRGVSYIRTTRMETPVLYDSKESFPLGGSKTIRSSSKDIATLIGAGVTLHEALAAHEALKERGIITRVMDLYSVKPIDERALRKAARETGTLIIAEDHYPEGGIAEAVRSALGDTSCRVIGLAVRDLARSGKPFETLAAAGIDRKSIVREVLRLKKRKMVE